MYSPFDMNGDGQMDIFESTMEMQFLFSNPCDSGSHSSGNITDYVGLMGNSSTDNSSRYSVSFDEMDDYEKEDALLEAGLTMDDLEDMDPEDVKDMLRDAGYDVD